MNKNNQTKLNINLLPLFLILVLILGAGYFLLGDEIKLPKLRKDPTEVTRLEGYPTFIYNQEDMERQRHVINSREQLNEFLNTIDSTGLLTIKEEIDFDKEMVIAVASSTNPTLGYKIKIKKVIEDQEKGVYTVSIIETEPGESCNEEPEKNIAVDIVRITKTDKDIEFERAKETKECN